MKGIFCVGVFLVLLSFSFFVGCELETQPSVQPNFPRASTLVINEVFTLPPSHPSTYSWIEFYNPDTSTIDLTNWTLSYFTERFRDSIIASLDSLGNLRSFREFFQFDTVGVLDVPFAGGLFEPPVRLPPNGLFTIVNNEARLLDHTNWGPGDERLRRERFSLGGTISSIDTIFSSPDSIVVTATFTGYSFFIQPKEQLILKDPSGKIVDVVRIGDSVYTNVIGDSTYPDPLLSSANRSIGSVPEFESIARYAGGYFTRNTENDFYITRRGLRPIPHWYSQKYK